LRLVLFAILSQIPFQLAFGNSTLNMIYTLLCCFLILVVMEKVSNPFLCKGLLLLLILATVNGDWPVVAPILTILLANDWGDRGRMTRDFCLTYLLFAVLNVQSYMSGEPGDWTLYAVTHALLSGLGILAAAVATLVLYNGERAKRGKNFSKWFFYVFYPGHLLILYLIKISLHNM
ncbi:MAG: conjugal transfer protein TraX, partial [Lachnospiraceae bacterium]|nr:conjugal transfer protein TraX [Lachnospiraceae bacterium]